MKTSSAEISAPLLIDLTAAARLLSLSERTVQILAKQNRIPSKKMGPYSHSRRMFSPAALQRWIDEAQDS